MGILGAPRSRFPRCNQGLTAKRANRTACEEQHTQDYSRLGCRIVFLAWWLWCNSRADRLAGAWGHPPAATN